MDLNNNNLFLAEIPNRIFLSLGMHQFYQYGFNFFLIMKKGWSITTKKNPTGIYYITYNNDTQFYFYPVNRWITL